MCVSQSTIIINSFVVADCPFYTFTRDLGNTPATKRHASLQMCSIESRAARFNGGGPLAAQAVVPDGLSPSAAPHRRTVWTVRHLQGVCVMKSSSAPTIRITGVDEKQDRFVASYCSEFPDATYERYSPKRSPAPWWIFSTASVCLNQFTDSLLLLALPGRCGKEAAPASSRKAILGLAVSTYEADCENERTRSCSNTEVA